MTAADGRGGGIGSRDMHHQNVSRPYTHTIPSSTDECESKLLIPQTTQAVLYGHNMCAAILPLLHVVAFCLQFNQELVGWTGVVDGDWSKSHLPEVAAEEHNSCDEQRRR